MNFGQWILVSFILFGVFIGVLVFVCVKQEVNLVSVNYYQEELVHSQKMNQVANTHDLASVPIITTSGDQLEVRFAQFNQLEKGELKLTRPSDSKLDQRFDLQLNSGETQQFTLSKWEHGLYRASMKWNMNGKEYFFEKLIVI